MHVSLGFMVYNIHPCPLACPQSRVAIDLILSQLYPKEILIQEILIPPTVLSCVCVVQHWQGLPGSDEETWHERAAGLPRSHQDPP